MSSTHEVEVDSTTVDIIGSHLGAIAEEMGVALMRAAYSANIKERMDCSTALIDMTGATWAQADHVPIHLGSMLGFIPGIMKFYTGNIAEGDIFISNDPYHGGSTHLPDLAVAAPLFVEGALVGFAASVAHHAEFGGSLGIATDIYSEGLRLPPVKIVSAGQTNDELMRTLLLNTRIETERIGDLRAQFAAVSLGARRYDELVAKYSAQTVESATQLWLDKAERQVRARISELPHGDYVYEDQMDSDGLGSTDIPIRVKITVDDRGLTYDFEGTGDQVAGSINTARWAVDATIYYVTKAVLDPTLPANAGFYRAINIHVPYGSVLNAKPPAPVLHRSDSCMRAADAILGAFGQILPERIPAASNGSIAAFGFSGFDPNREKHFAYVEVIAGGAGAMEDMCGQSAVQTHLTNTANTPVEVVESAYPLRVRSYQVRRNSGGAGHMRGGDGIIREIETLAPDIRLTVKGDRVAYGPWGLQGGEPGSTLKFYLNYGTEQQTEFTRAQNGTALPMGTVVSAMTAGGGGYGIEGNGKGND